MRSILPLLMAAALSGCAATRPAESPIVLRLAPRIARIAQPQPSIVAPVQVQGLSGERRYTYVDRAKGSELLQAKTLFWEEPPSAVMERALIDALGAPILPTGRSSVTERRLAARLVRFEERTGGAQAEAVVALDTELLSTGTRGVLAMGRYCAHTPIDGPTPSDRARAFEAAIGKVAAAVAQDTAADRGRSESCSA